MQTRGIFLSYLAKYGDIGVPVQEFKKILGWDDTTFNINLQEAKLYGFVTELPNGNICLAERVKGQFPTS